MRMYKTEKSPASSIFFDQEAGQKVAQIIFFNALFRIDKTEWQNNNISENKFMGHGEQWTGKPLLGHSLPLFYSVLATFVQR